MLEEIKNIYTVSTYNLSAHHDEFILLEINVPDFVKMKIRHIEIFVSGIPHMLELIINPFVISGTYEVIPVRHHISTKYKSSNIKIFNNPKSIEQREENIVWVVSNLNDIYPSGLTNQVTPFNDFIFEKGVYILRLTNKSNSDVSMCLMLNWEEVTV